MIKTEQLIINYKQFTKSYSDSGYMIERDGVQYSEAIDPTELGRTYTETDIPIEGETGLTVSDTLELLSEMGVDVSDQQAKAQRKRRKGKERHKSRFAAYL